ncbi:hypothetical protein [Novosphingobium mangrovi (ex Huang et al. 2023)]|uniref:Uncharacterized protein n=1 Tax=Novosphingobium mangrovi (ex Huang et al. 2023) TaxID=2976432 RepID=A0ABT2I9Z7_9SPHN|nr:hypothetical protein [Novosphingobium mangrovi (ex Huang et al. 2023)]MCT2401657.1 hypothetical protein [Novosphingobium mangrovi (ex Huang et al. 2023)]
MKAFAASKRCRDGTAMSDTPRLECAFRDICAGNARFLAADQSLIDAGRMIAGMEGAGQVF